MWCTKSAAERRYLSRVLVSMAGYVLAIAGVSWMFAHRHPQGATVYLLALLPALPIFAVIAILGIYLSEEKDEFVRTVLVKSSLWATGVVLAFATFWGFLQSYAPAINRTVNFPMYCVFIVWWVSFGLAEPLVRRTYK